MAPPETTPNPMIGLQNGSGVVVVSNPHHRQDDDDKEESAAAQAALIADSVAFPMTMLSAIDLGLLEIISKKERPLSASEVVAELKTENPLAVDMVDRILSLLAAFEVVSCTVAATAIEQGGGIGKKGSDKVYGMTRVAKFFVKDEDGVSLGPLMRLIQDKVFLESWIKVKDSVLEGGVPFDKAHGMNAFEYPGTDPRFNKVFNEAMYNHTIIMMRKILQTYKGFENIQRLVDVGGGLGQNLKIILSQYPNIKGVNYDLPHVTKHGVSHPGMEHVGGDMFESVPSGDAIFIKWILHDWSDEHCLKLLKNCHKALPSNGKVIVGESIVAEEPETTIIAKAVCEMDLIMMTQNPGGKERTKKDFISLADAAGFSSVTFEAYAYGIWIMEFHK